MGFEDFTPKNAETRRKLERSALEVKTTNELHELLFAQAPKEKPHPKLGKYFSAAEALLVKEKLEFPKITSSPLPAKDLPAALAQNLSDFEKQLEREIDQKGIRSVLEGKIMARFMTDQPVGSIEFEKFANELAKVMKAHNIPLKDWLAEETPDVKDQYRQLQTYLLRFVNRVSLAKGFTVIQGDGDNFVTLPLLSGELLRSIHITYGKRTIHIPSIPVLHKPKGIFTQFSRWGAWNSRVGVVLLGEDSVGNASREAFLHEMAETYPWVRDIVHEAQTKGIADRRIDVEWHEGVHVMHHDKWPENAMLEMRPGGRRPYPRQTIFIAAELEFFDSAAMDVPIFAHQLDELAACGYEIQQAAGVTRAEGLLEIFDRLNVHESSRYQLATEFFVNMLRKSGYEIPAGAKVGDVAKAVFDLQLTKSQLQTIGSTMYALGMKGMAKFDELTR